MNYLLRGLFVVHPFIQYLFIGKSISTTMALSGIALSLIVFLFFLRSEKVNIKVSFPYFWFWVLCQTIFLNQKSLFGNGNLHVCIFYCIHISIFFIMYYSIVFSKFDFNYVVKPLGYVCLFFSTFCILQHVGITQFTYDAFKKPGMLGNPTNSAMYIVALTSFVFQYKYKWFLVLLPTTACILLGSASAILGLASLITCYLIIKRNWIALGIGTIAVIGGIIKFGGKIIDLRTHDKLQIWYMAIKDWMHSSWLGLGMGAFRGKYGVENTIVRFEFVHNHFLWVLYCLGLIGLICFIIFLVDIFKRKEKNLLALLSLIAVGVMSTCSVPMRVYPIVLLTAFNMGVITRGNDISLPS